MAEIINQSPHAGNQDPVDINPNLDPSTPAEMGEMVSAEKLTQMLIDIKTQNTVWNYSFEYDKRSGKLKVFFEDNRGCAWEELTIPAHAHVAVWVGRDGQLHYSWSTGNGSGGGIIPTH